MVIEAKWKAEEDQDVTTKTEDRRHEAAQGSGLKKKAEGEGDEERVRPEVEDEVKTGVERQ